MWSKNDYPFSGCEKIVELLIKNGASVTQKDNTGKVPSYLDVYKGKFIINSYKNSKMKLNFFLFFRS